MPPSTGRPHRRSREICRWPGNGAYEKAKSPATKGISWSALRALTLSCCVHVYYGAISHFAIKRDVANAEGIRPSNLRLAFGADSSPFHLSLLRESNHSRYTIIVGAIRIKQCLALSQSTSVCLLR